MSTRIYCLWCPFLEQHIDFSMKTPKWPRPSSGLRDRSALCLSLSLSHALSLQFSYKGAITKKNSVTLTRLMKVSGGIWPPSGGNMCQVHVSDKYKLMNTSSWRYHTFDMVFTHTWIAFMQSHTNANKITAHSLVRSEGSLHINPAYTSLHIVLVVTA